MLMLMMVSAASLAKVPLRSPLTAASAVRSGSVHREPGFVPPALVARLRKELAALSRAGRFQEGTSHRSDGQRDDLRSAITCKPDITSDAFLMLYDRLDDVREELANQLGREHATGIEATYCVYPPGGYYRRHCDSVEGVDVAGSGRRSVSFICYLNEPGWSTADGGALRVEAAVSSSPELCSVAQVPPAEDRWDDDDDDDLWDDDDRSDAEACSAGDDLVVDDAVQEQTPAPVLVPIGQASEILPETGLLVLFDSKKLWHEVLPTARERACLVGWFLHAAEPPSSLPPPPSPPPPSPPPPSPPPSPPPPSPPLSPPSPSPSPPPPSPPPPSPPSPRQRPSPRHAAVRLRAAVDGSSNLVSPTLPPDCLLLRYFYEGGTISEGQLCPMASPARSPAASASAASESIAPASAAGETIDPGAASVGGLDVLRALEHDGVDLSLFYACCYEARASGGGWLPLLREVTDPNAELSAEACDVRLPLPSGATSPRVDVKLIRRHSISHEAALAEAASSPTASLRPKGHFAIGIVQAKSADNVGTLWRSAYQLGASFIFTVARRYREQQEPAPAGRTRARAGDTLDVPSRMPLLELDDWSSFVQHCSPQGAEWVAVEMGGVPLDQFEHPRNAVYLLGSEDWGLPSSIARECQHVVSLSSERFASYNVASAGAIVMYDRLAKERAVEKAAAEKAGGEGAARRRRLRALRRGNFPGRIRRGI